MEIVEIEKLVHGGQGLARLANGSVVFVWNSLPGEKVRLKITKKRKDYSEGFAEEIIEASKDRCLPKDDSYMSTSPWQIMGIDLENDNKKAILEEAFEREKVIIPEIQFDNNVNEWNYRNKMEYSFWADDNGLSLALYHRGTHRKMVLSGSSIARKEIDEAANKLIEILNNNKVRGSDLKTCIVRCDRQGNVVIALFVKNKEFKKISDLNGAFKGIEVCYSNPKSPASVKTEVLYTYGDITLNDKLLDKELKYDAYSFFQVNLDVFEKVLSRIKEETQTQSKIDFYCGVGSIGVPIGDTKVFVDIDESNYEYALKNVDKSAKVLLSSSEKAVDLITSEDVLIVDPPRAGIHNNLIEKIQEVKPPKIIYLSCNPSTQARDIKLLEDFYDVNSIIGYNFFPKTPHIESLAVMILK
jgi:23S rRNA (uracil1939-C5)-methyltransferase